MKNFLPSKKFTYAGIVIIVLCIVAFFIFNFFFQRNSSFFSNKKAGLVPEQPSVGEITQQDSDNDGVVDWEETLWGTDKNKQATFNGVPDLAYIKNKKNELNIDTTAKNDSELTETEKFAKEFFATYVAMKTSGSDATTIENFSNALGQKIVYPALIDSYKEENLKIKQNETEEDKFTYYESISTLFENYKSKGMGDELSIVANGLTSTGTAENSNKLLTIASAYQDFAKKVANITVPQSLVSYQLNIANSSNNTGISIISMTKINSDPIVGLSGLSQYQKYSDEFIKASQDLTTKVEEQ